MLPNRLPKGSQACWAYMTSVGVGEYVAEEVGAGGYVADRVSDASHMISM